MSFCGQFLLKNEVGILVKYAYLSAKKRIGCKILETISDFSKVSWRRQVLVITYVVKVTESDEMANGGGELICSGKNDVDTNEEVKELLGLHIRA